ncbi:DinB family protein [Metabacillus idriensis]|uniref:DinB family protein n=1 Tax=Metabacillus idriensis TaxID=324768 RepID=UPI0017489301|nr:DinB family protein [Metabacillus idriensis]
MKTININEKIKKYQGFISYVKSLRNLNEEMWTSPIAENKWSVRDIIGHIMIWDKYILEEAIIKIYSNQPVTVQDVNIDEFNKNAVEYVKTKDQDEIINQTIHYRKELIETLMLLSDEQFFNNYIDSSGNNFSVNSFLEDFIPHDDHHKRQIEEFLN